MVMHILSLRPPRWMATHACYLTALAAAGVLPPIGLIVVPGGLSAPGVPAPGILLTAALMVAMALVAVAVGLRGFETVLSRLRAQAGGEHRQIVIRILLGSILADALALAAALPTDGAGVPCLRVGALGLAAAWLLVFYLILAPSPSAMRRHRAVTPAELYRKGEAYVKRLGIELTRLDAVLVEYLAAAK